MKLEFSQVSKIAQIPNFMKIAKWELSSVQTNGQTDMMKLIVAFHNFANVHKSKCINIVGV
jgi:hypothetical protein